VNAVKILERSDDKSTSGFLEQVSLAADTDEIGPVELRDPHDGAPGQGLEFPSVFMTGMEEGYFRSGNPTFRREDLEEERRLCMWA